MPDVANFRGAGLVGDCFPQRWAEACRRLSFENNVSFAGKHCFTSTYAHKPQQTVPFNDNGF